MSYFTKKFYKNSSFNLFVIAITLTILALFITITITAPEQIQNLLGIVKHIIFKNFSWLYVLSFSFFIGFLIILALSDIGSITLGDNEEEPEFGFLSWIAMLFAAGMGVGLMFFGVAEPLTHFASPITTGDIGEKTQQALTYTMFHWGIHAWGVYAVIALALAYFGFRYKLPLSLRSCFYPLLKNKINGRLGDVIDIIALISTLFGIITTLGYGAAQLGAGLEYIGLLSENTFMVQSIIIICVMFIAIMSAVSGVGKGVKILSEANLLLATSLLIFVLITGPTIYLLSAFSDNLGMYLNNSIVLSFKTYIYDQLNVNWFADWTILYWAWWCSWAPFVGLFIARISRGRTIRQFVLGVLAVPSLFCVLWFTTFGDTAIWLDLNVANGALSSMISSPEKLLFKFLSYLPLPMITRGIALIIISLFFITSADSGIYVLNNIASRDKSLDSPKWQAFMWGILMIIISITLIASGGLDALQSTTLIVSLPFVIMMLIMCVSLFKAVMADKKYFAAKKTPINSSMATLAWKDCLNKVLNQTQERDILKFLKYTALPAMRELRQEMVNVHNLDVEIKETLTDDDRENFVQITIKKASMRDFVYGIKSVAHDVSHKLVKDNSLPYIQFDQTYLPITFFSDGRTGYDVQYMTRTDIIGDILRQYERYLHMMNEVGQELLVHEQTKLAE